MSAEVSSEFNKTPPQGAPVQLIQTEFFIVGKERPRLIMRLSRKTAGLSGGFVSVARKQNGCVRATIRTDSTGRNG